MNKIVVAAVSSLAILAASPVVSAPAHAESATWLKIEGHWNEFAGKVKQRWGKLTDDDLTVIKGHRQELIGKIQERYGIAKAEAEKQVDQWEKTQKVLN